MIRYKLEMYVDNDLYKTYSSDNVDCTGVITKNIISNGSIAKITLFNISQADYVSYFITPLNFINRKKMFFRLYLSTSNNKEEYILVCEKDVYKATPSFNNTNMTNSVELFGIAGINALSSIYTLNQTGVTQYQIVNNIGKAFSLPIAHNTLNDTQKYNFVQSPTIGSDILEVVAKQFNVDVYVDDGKIFALNKNDIIRENKTDIVITSTPQLDGNSLITEALLNPYLTCGTSIELKSSTAPFLNDRYKIIKLMHSFTSALTGQSKGTTTIYNLYKTPYNFS